MRLRNPRFSKYMPNGAGGYTREPHFTLTQECAVCGKMALIRLKDGELISRLDGRTKLGQSSAEEIFEGLTAEPTDAELADF